MKHLRTFLLLLIFSPRKWGRGGGVDEARVDKVHQTQDRPRNNDFYLPTHLSTLLPSLSPFFTFFRHSLLSSIPFHLSICLHFFLSTYFPTSYPTYWLNFFPSFFSSFLLPFFPFFLPSSFPVYLPMFPSFHIYLLTYLFPIIFIPFLPSSLFFLPPLFLFSSLPSFVVEPTYRLSPDQIDLGVKFLVYRDSPSPFFREEVVLKCKVRNWL